MDVLVIEVRYDVGVVPQVHTEKADIGGCVARGEDHIYIEPVAVRIYIGEFVRKYAHGGLLAGDNRVVAVDGQLGELRIESMQAVEVLLHRF